MNIIDQIKLDNSLTGYLQKQGLVLTRKGGEFVTLCWNHDDHHPSLRVNEQKGLFFCDVCQSTGSIIDAMIHFEGLTMAAIIKKYGKESSPGSFIAPPPHAPVVAPAEKLFCKQQLPCGEKETPNPFAPEPKLVAEYAYQNEVGDEIFKVFKYEPKKFRQGRRNPNGTGILWNLDGVRRVIYNLPEVLKAKRVFIAEGESCCDALHEIGHVATTNSGGAGKWMDPYSEYFEGKEVIICPDNDEPGHKHAERVRESVAKYAKWIKQIKIPVLSKDIRDYLEAGGLIEKLIDAAPKLYKGLNVPVMKLCDARDEYVKSIEQGDEYGLDLGKWLPSLRKYRKLIPGEVLLLMGFTGSGKTACMENIAKISAPLKTLIFELELPISLLYERQIGIERDITGDNVEKNFKLGNELFLRHADHIYVCPQPKMDLETMERIIGQSELVIGEKPKLVIVDYVQLFKGKGKTRYETMSELAEQMKVVARSLEIIVVIISQPSRPPKDKVPQLSLYSPKDSGSLESSAGMVMGIQRDIDDQSKAVVKVFKCTKGCAGLEIQCNFNDSLKITEIYKGESK